MSFFKNLGTGISTYGRAMSFIATNNLWGYFAYPLVIVILLFLGGTALILGISDSLGDYLETLVLGLLGLGDDAEGWLSFLKGSLSFILKIGLKIVLFFVYLSVQKYIVLIIMSPILALLSERVDEILTGNKYPFNADQFVRDMFRGIAIALRNMFIEFGFILLFLLISWIPLIGWLSPIVLYVISCYFYGFSMIDYTSERRRLSVGQSVAFIRRNKGFAIGNGFIYSLIFMIPFAGILFAPILGAVAATLGTYEVLEKEKLAGVK